MQTKSIHHCTIWHGQLKRLQCWRESKYYKLLFAMENLMFDKLKLYFIDWMIDMTAIVLIWYLHYLRAHMETICRIIISSGYVWIIVTLKVGNNIATKRDKFKTQSDIKTLKENREPEVKEQIGTNPQFPWTHRFDTFVNKQTN